MNPHRPSEADRLPSVISHYRILRRLGSGGMGEVYLALDLTLGRQVALKVLPARSLEDSSAKRRLLKEAQAAATLDHPNICSIYEAGEDGPHTFIVMQYVEGETLAARMLSKPPSLREALRIARQVADALAEAHVRGVIHRDVKPSNIMLTPSGVAKLMDFGLAKVSSEDERSAVTVSALTGPGVVLGTPSYMSPEQACGEHVDFRTDIFSFGAVLYKLLTGRHPFGSASKQETIAAILSKAPLPFAACAIDAPPELEEMVLRALAKDREQRYQSARDLSHDLGKVEKDLDSGPGLRGLAAQAGAVGGVARLAALMTRGRLAVVGGLLAALVAAWLSSTRPAPALTDRDTILIADFRNSTGDPDLGDALKRALAVQLAQSPFLNIFSDESVNAALQLMRRPPDEPVTATLAREICQRQGLTAVLAGSIGHVGSLYVIGLEAMNAQTGDVIAREQAEAPSKDLLLRQLGSAASRLRKKLGESLQSIQKYDVAIEQATTSSLKALKAFSLGRKLAKSGDQSRQARAGAPILSARHPAGSGLRAGACEAVTQLRQCQPPRACRRVRSACVRTS
jgi:hypothetical protein